MRMTKSIEETEKKLEELLTREPHPYDIATRGLVTGGHIESVGYISTYLEQRSDEVSAKQALMDFIEKYVHTKDTVGSLLFVLESPLGRTVMDKMSQDDLGEALGGYLGIKMKERGLYEE